MKSVSLILAGLSVSLFASVASASQEKCSFTTLNEMTGQQYAYTLEIFWSNANSNPYHILVRDALGRVQTFDNNSTTHPTIVEVTSGFDQSRNYYVEGKDGTPASIRVVWTGTNADGSDAVSLTATLPALGFKHVQAPVIGSCK